MIDTNALLSIGFSLVANFSSVVQIPEQEVPKKADDLARYVVGSPHSPLDLYLVDRRGTEFWIRDGAVYEFLSPGSFSHAQSLAGITNFLGERVIGAAEALALSKQTVERLARKGSPVLHIDPVVGPPKYARGHEVPFYEIVWPKTNGIGYRYYAAVEVDARKKLIVFLNLPDESFRDYEVAGQVSNRVYKPDPPPSAATQTISPRLSEPPHPTTNQVLRALAGWVWLSRRLGVNEVTQPSIASVDWSKTGTFTNFAFSRTEPVCQVWLTNGMCFEAVGDVAYSHFAADEYFAGGWQAAGKNGRFEGVIVKDWRALSSDLERVLVQRLQIPHEMLASLRARPSTRPPDIGTTALKRVVIEWQRSPPDSETSDVAPMAPGPSPIAAEFDLETGELKWIAFADPGLIAALREALLKTR